MYILGLDISTRYIGWSALDHSGKFITGGYIDFTKPKNMNLSQKLEKFIKETDGLFKDVDLVCIEEPVKAFSFGKSTIDTIIKCNVFNFAICNELYKQKLNVVHVNARTAVSIFGLKIPKHTKPKDKKEMVRACVENKFPQIYWPKKRTGTYCDHAYDMADSVVIANAGVEFKTTNKTTGFTVNFW